MTAGRDIAFPYRMKQSWALQFVARCGCVPCLPGALCPEHGPKRPSWCQSREIVRDSSSISATDSPLLALNPIHPLQWGKQRERGVCNQVSHVPQTSQTSVLPTSINASRHQSRRGASIPPKHMKLFRKGSIIIYTHDLAKLNTILPSVPQALPLPAVPVLAGPVPGCRVHVPATYIGSSEVSCNLPRKYSITKLTYHHPALLNYWKQCISIPRAF